MKNNLKIEYSNFVANWLSFIIVIGNIFWVFKDIHYMKVMDKNLLLLCLLCRLLPILIFPFCFMCKKEYKQYIIFSIVWVSIILQQVLTNQVSTNISGEDYITWIIVFLSLSLIVDNKYIVGFSYGIYLILFIISDVEFCGKFNFPRTILSGGTHYDIGGHRLLLTLIPITTGCIILNNAIDKMYDVIWKQRDNIKFESEHDSLSKLYNRHILSSILKDDKYVKDGCLILLDVDEFKKYNDIYGHDKGDEIIISVSNKLISVFKNISDYIIRFGGDEFLIITENVNDVENYIDKLGKDIPLSIGYCYFTKDDNFYAVIKKCDIALYHTKNNGRNGYTNFEDVKK